MMGELLYLGITHASAPLAIRETLRPAADKQRAMLDRLAPIADGRMVLSTCERFELYATTRRGDLDIWLDCLANWFHLPARLLRSHITVLRGLPAAEHLLRVAGGLESRILGEPQILGQVRQAYARTLEARAADAVLAALGRAAIRAGRRVRHETAINRERLSIAAIAVEWLERTAGPLPVAKVAVIGTGRLAADVVNVLAERGSAPVAIAGRNAERARLLARVSGGVARPLAALREVVADADVVIACTSAPSYLLDAAIVGRRRSTPLAIVDLSVPRNVDPSLGVTPGVHLAHLDDLVNGLTGDGAGVAEATAVVWQELVSFDRWCKERRAVPAIVRLISHACAPASYDPRAVRRELHRRIARLKAGAAA